jgi:L-asparagine transporter-like permease
VKSHGGEARVGSVVEAAVLVGTDDGGVGWSVDTGDVTGVVDVGAAVDGVEDVVGVAESDEPEPHAASPNSTTGRTRRTRISYLLSLQLVVTIVRRT